MKVFSLVLALPLLASARLLVDYTGGSNFDSRSFGNKELEGNALGCKISQAGDAAFIRSGTDPSNKRPALHFHRDPHFRRAEVKALGQGTGKEVVKDRTYYIGYNFRLDRKANGLVIFQWKKWDKNAAPKQNIPLYVHFDGKGDLVIEYTTPGGNGSNRRIVWRGPISVGNGAEHRLAFVINTAQGGKGWLEFYVDGQKQRFDGKERLTNVELFTGGTSPKFGIYRAESAGGGAAFCPKNNIFNGKAVGGSGNNIYNNYVYRVQISDSSLAEISAAAGTIRRRSYPPQF